ncbi:MAG: DUF488 domain-containing protein, partial [Chloroflexi bacterium]
MTIYTIGFTKTSAEAFFTRLQSAPIKSLVDVRLNNVSQLAGFTKKDDLKYFLRIICSISYEHRPELAPKPELLDAYRRRLITWTDYENAFLELMKERRIQTLIPRSLIDGSCLLCSEASADRCHRRLVAEYLASEWGNVDIVHL